jgi:hypothetical protein
MRVLIGATGSRALPETSWTGFFSELVETRDLAEALDPVTATLPVPNITR